MYSDVGLSLLAFLLFTFVAFLIFAFLKPGPKPFVVLLGLEEFKQKSLLVLLEKVYRVVGLLGLLLVFFALARPQEKKIEPRSSEKGIDILFVLDISDSMLIEDMAPLENRLESAKYHIKEFIKNRPSDRMGLVVFSGEAYTRVPLTLDHTLLIQSLDQTEISENIKKGTAIGVALAAGVNRVRESKSKSKVVVLLTDGENNTGVIDPLTALDLTVDSGAKAYTIGIGRDGQSQLPVFRKDRYGRKIKTYRPFPTKINEKLLKEIAFKTKGQFYRASVESDMSRIFEEIDRLETSDIKQPDVYKVIENFQNLLLNGILLLFLFFVLELSLFWRGI